MLERLVRKEKDQSVYNHSEVSDSTFGAILMQLGPIGLVQPTRGDVVGVTLQSIARPLEFVSLHSRYDFIHTNAIRCSS